MMDDTETESQWQAGILVDRPVGWNIDEGDLGYLGAAAYGVVISCVGILEWYLISTSPGRSVPYMSCRHTSMVCPSMVSI